MMRKVVVNSLALNPRSSFVSDDRDTVTFSGLVNELVSKSLKITDKLVIVTIRLLRRMSRNIPEGFRRNDIKH